MKIREEKIMNLKTILFIGAIYAKNVKINANQRIDKRINSFFIGNSADDNDGGAIYATEDVIVKNTEFSNNAAMQDGGGISAETTVDVGNCEFNNNSALGTTLGSGGGIYSKKGVTVENSTFNGNFAHSFGPAIYCIKDIKINRKSASSTYLSYFIKNKAGGKTYTDQIYVDKDHGKIISKNIIIMDG